MLSIFIHTNVDSLPHCPIHPVSTYVCVRVIIYVCVHFAIIGVWSFSDVCVCVCVCVCVFVLYGASIIVLHM